MGANETRLLVLSALALLEPANGYQVRRELVAWGIDKWAHVQPGSIYSSLSTLAKHGDIEEVPNPDGSRGVTSYRLTEQGHRERQRLFEQAMTTVEPTRPLAFFSAISLCGSVTRECYLDLLRRRLAHHEEWERTVVPARSDDLPDYVKRILAYRDAGIHAEMQWIRDTIAEVERGGLAFTGEDEPWIPRVTGDRLTDTPDPERYRRMLGLEAGVPPRRRAPSSRTH